jgi:hypothetical protein
MARSISADIVTRKIQNTPLRAPQTSNESLCDEPGSSNSQDNDKQPEKLTTHHQDQSNHTPIPEVEADNPRALLQLTNDERTWMDISDVHTVAKTMETGDLTNLPQHPQVS